MNLLEQNFGFPSTEGEAVSFSHADNIYKHEAWYCLKVTTDMVENYAYMKKGERGIREARR